MPDARHRRPGNGRQGHGLHRREKNATAGGAGRFEKTTPDARAAPPEAHESLISPKTGAEVPLTGLSFDAAPKSQDAAKESFVAFRKNPDWLAAREASEKKAGGSLTEKEGGVVSEFFVGTEYSPLK